jgi:DNA-binding CsgD family transcriptional regulator
MKAEADLVDLIYEAALIPDVWPDVLDRLGEMADALAAVLFSLNQHGSRWLGNEAGIRLMGEYVNEGWMTKNTRLQRLVASGHSGFVTDHDFFTAEEMARDEAYTGFFWPRGLGESTGTLILVPNGDMLFFNFERLRERGPVERHVVETLDRLRPHLARAALISARRQFERARTAVDTLEGLGLAAAALSVDGRVMAVNRSLELSAPQVLIGARDRIALPELRADALMREALARIAAGDTKIVASIPLPSVGTHAAAVLHIVPIRRDARDIFSGTLALVVLTALTPSPSPGIDLLAGLFDLSPAEARVARAISQGQTMQYIAVRQGLSSETVRSQLKAVLAKTGTSRQAELVALLARTVLVR